MKQICAGDLSGMFGTLDSDGLRLTIVDNFDVKRVHVPHEELLEEIVKPVSDGHSSFEERIAALLDEPMPKTLSRKGKSASKSASKSRSRSRSSSKKSVSKRTSHKSRKSAKSRSKSSSKSRKSRR